MRRKRGKLNPRGLLGVAAILMVLFALGAGGAILFTRMRGHSDLAELLAQSPMAAVHPASPTPESRNRRPRTLAQPIPFPPREQPI